MKLSERVYNTAVKRMDLFQGDMEYVLDATINYIMFELGFDNSNEEAFDTIVDCMDSGESYERMLKILEEVE